MHLTRFGALVKPDRASLAARRSLVDSSVGIAADMSLTACHAPNRAIETGLPVPPVSPCHAYVRHGPLASWWLASFARDRMEAVRIPC